MAISLKAIYPPATKPTTACNWFPPFRGKSLRRDSVCACYTENMANTAKTEDEWKQALTPEQYHIMREGGTEAPYSGHLLHNKDSGMYNCAACSAQLFASDTKYESDEPGLAGWPSFYDALPGAVEFRDDNSLGMQRIEVVCANCGSHLGHIFPDRTATGKHYCINSTCLVFKPKPPKQ